MITNIKVNTLTIYLVYLYQFLYSNTCNVIESWSLGQL